MKNNKLSRKERESQRHRKEILDVALDLFSEKSLYAVTMIDIAKEAEFSVGTLYKFFKNKENIYRELILETASKFNEALNIAIKREGTEKDKVMFWIEMKFKLFTDNRKLMKLYLIETMGVDYNVKVGLKDEIKLIYNNMLNRLEQVFKKNKDSYLLALALEGISNTLFFKHIETPDKYNIKPETVLNIFYNKISMDNVGNKAV